MASQAFDYDVLIAGAGPVGLGLAIELGQRGIKARVVERNDRVGYTPRAKTSNVRTREHLRRWGIADNLRRASPIPPDYPPDVVFATRMNGHELARFKNAFNGRREKNELYSEEAQWVPQYTVEEVLRAHAATLTSVAITFDTELTAVEQDAAGVTAELLDLGSGARTTVRAQYLVGADGARSFVRTAIGARMQGDGDGIKNYNIVFRSPDFADKHTLGKAIMYWIVNADVPSVIGPMDDHDLWAFIATKLPANVELESLDAAKLIRDSTGLHDIQIEILRKDPWVSRSLVADTYSSGRMFLAGDACHLHPPFGGFGMNMGVGDAVDLGWKLAATLQGWGGPELLASYEPERRPVHERTIAESKINYATVGNQLVQPAIEEPGETGDAARLAVGSAIQATKIREFSTLGLVLGARYRGSAILVSDGTEPPAEHFSDYVPTAFPGCLAPHAWLADGSSLYDHFGQGYTLLVTGEAVATDAVGAEAIVVEAGRRGMPLTVVIPRDARLPGLYAARLALIRPDQHVAWRGDALPADIAGLLDHVTGFRAADDAKMLRSAAE